ncbi:hypothetical protein DB88DRAFT_528515 [Papiliotrema laurentii]|uniref:Uncharacterized protein n=1 Tax=Papiliotrema laurentii TaxID=5418 RepID=A0AAD9CX09_PAPLA|nr:hypothetical protein DB88DRAFT_528515 [Papiliotrema laurentii]
MCVWDTLTGIFDDDSALFNVVLYRSETVPYSVSVTMSGRCFGEDFTGPFYSLVVLASLCDIAYDVSASKGWVAARQLIVYRRYILLTHVLAAVSGLSAVLTGWGMVLAPLVDEPGELVEGSFGWGEILTSSMTIVAWTLASAFCQLSKRLIEESEGSLVLSTPDIKKGPMAVEQGEEKGPDKGAEEEEQGELMTLTDPRAIRVEDVQIQTSGRLIDL